MVKGVRKMKTFVLHSAKFCIIEIHRQNNSKLHSCYISSIFYLLKHKKGKEIWIRLSYCASAWLLIKAVLLKFNLEIFSNSGSYSCRAFLSRSIYKRYHDNDSDVMSNWLTLKNQLKRLTQLSLRNQTSRWLSTDTSQQWLHLPRKHFLFKVERTLH